MLIENSMIKKENDTIILSAINMFEMKVITYEQMMDIFYKVRGIDKSKQNIKRPVGRPKKFDIPMMDNVD